MLSTTERPLSTLTRIRGEICVNVGFDKNQKQVSACFWDSRASEAPAAGYLCKKIRLLKFGYFATRRIRLSDDSTQTFSVSGLYALPFTS